MKKKNEGSMREQTSGKYAVQEVYAAAVKSIVS